MRPMPSFADLRVLFVENDDSFSWNVVETLPVAREQVRWLGGAALEGRLPTRGFDLVVVGPGPLDPVRAGLVPLVTEALERRVPLLGVCLGHQALGLACGARLVRTTPMHGKRSRVTFAAESLLPGVEGEHTVMRYHSLALDDVKPPLRVIARTDDGTVMAIAHEDRPALGFQFHPDSFGSPTGRALVHAFFTAVAGGAT